MQVSKFEQYLIEARANKWFRWFTVFCRIILALSFVPSGYIKLIGERFTALPATHPLGQYFEALHHTGFYFNFVGLGQLLTALLLIIPRTALLGALAYFPVILNICVLAYATRFEGTRITTLMLLANVYLLCWDYQRLKSILPFKQAKAEALPAGSKASRNKFPFLFFGGVVLSAAIVIAGNHYLYDIRPGNSSVECTNGCKGNDNPAACERFCECIYTEGQPLGNCLAEFEKEKKK